MRASAVSAGIKRESLEHVAEVHARGLDLDQDLAASAGWQREGREAQAVEQTALAGLEAQRHRGIELLLARRQAASDALHVACLAAEGDFALVVHMEQFDARARHDPISEASGGRSMPRQE